MVGVERDKDVVKESVRLARGVRLGAGVERAPLTVLDFRTASTAATRADCNTLAHGLS